MRSGTAALAVLLALVLGAGAFLCLGHLRDRSWPGNARELEHTVEVELRLMEETLELAEGSRELAAKPLGIASRTI